MNNVETSSEKEPLNLPRSVEELLNEREYYLLDVKEIIFVGLEQNETVKRLTRPIFEPGAPDRLDAQIDHYNESEPFEVSGQEVALVRDEKRFSEDSVVRPYVHNQEKDVWVPMPNTKPMVGYQDPSYLGDIKGERYISLINTRKKETGGFDYWPELFKIQGDLNHLEPVAQGPLTSKGLHLIETPDKICGFIRPQEGKYNRGKICYFEMPEMTELPGILENLDQKTEIIDIFKENEWGGVNDLHLLPDGRLEVLGHIARKVNEGTKKEYKEYYIFSAIFDPATREMSDLKIIITCKDLVDFGIKITPKKPGYGNIAYPTAFISEKDRLHVYLSGGDTTPLVATCKRSLK